MDRIHAKIGLLLSVCLGTQVVAKDFGYADLLEVTRRIPKVIFYFVSDGMPLSEPGLRNLRAAARRSGYRVRVLHDPLRPLESEKPVRKAALSKEFREEGVFLHFPSLLLYRAGKKCGNLVPGYKEEKTYHDLIQFLENRCGAPAATFSAPSPSEGEVTVVSETPLPHAVRYFFHPVGQEWVAYHTGKNNFLFNRMTGREIRLPGRYDVAPTPDDAFLTIPGQRVPPDLSFYSTAEILAGPDDQSQIPPLFHDPEMTDQYQYAGAYRHGYQKFFRVATAWFSALKFRDYRVDGQTLTPEGSPTPLCSAFNISTPMISRNARRIGALNNATGTTHVFDIGPQGDRCDIVRDLGFKTGKVSIDPSGNRIAFDAVVEGIPGAYVQCISCGKITRLAEAPPGGLAVFPQFMKNGNFMYLKVTGETQSLVEVTVR